MTPILYFFMNENLFLKASCLIIKVEISKSNALLLDINTGLLSDRSIMDFPAVKKVWHSLDLERPFELWAGFCPKASQALSGDSHYSLQICVVLSGAHEVVYESHRMLAEQGQFWLTSCWEPHLSRAAADNTGYLVITIPPELLGAADIFHETDWLAPFFAPPGERPQAVAREKRDGVLSKALEIKDLYEKTAPGWRTLVWLKLHELVLAVSEDWSHEKQSFARNSFMRILPAIRHVRSHPEKPLSVADAGRLCSMGRTAFSNLFTKVTGKSFAAFALNARVSEAAGKLAGGSLPVKDIAAAAGFSDLPHFYRVFKRVFKCSPVKYRDTNGAAVKDSAGEEPRL
jgi:AraC-like DNA-binding protein